MANQEHLAILKQGVEVWNQWRSQPYAPQDMPHELSEFLIWIGKHPYIQPDLREADLAMIDFRNADFGLTLLDKADLRKAKLFGANFFGSHLTETDFSGADLTAADFTSAHFDKTNFSRCLLLNTVFSPVGINVRSHLIERHFGITTSSSEFAQVNFTQAVMSTTFIGAIDLRMAKGLETVRHHGPSNITLGAIYRSEGNIPEIFLHRAGVPSSFIEYMHSLVIKPIDYYTCFISYSSKNEDFAKRLYADLQTNGVRCWYAPHALRPGTIIREGVDEAIRMYDKLILILSQEALESGWVRYEVEVALLKERKKNASMLFPIRLDNAILDCTEHWAESLLIRHIGDFTRWKQHDDYQQAFTRLLHDLKAESKREEL